MLRKYTYTRYDALMVMKALLGEIQDTVSAVTKSTHLTFRTREGPIRTSQKQQR